MKVFRNTAKLSTRLSALHIFGLKKKLSRFSKEIESRFFFESNFIKTCDCSSIYVTIPHICHTKLTYRLNNVICMFFYKSSIHYTCIAILETIRNILLILNKNVNQATNDAAGVPY